MKALNWLLRIGAAVLFLPSLLAAQQVLEEVHVTGAPLQRSASELAQSVTVLRDQTLDRIRADNLGETLSNQLGVGSSYFGAGSSRPIIRGLAGARVKTMEDGIDSMDVATTSGDHAVGIDPFVAEQIEIFRGPTTLLYGSGAVGGIVNTVTRRIPEFAPDGGFEGAIELRADTVSNGESVAVAVDGGRDRFAWHFDAHRRDADDYEIPRSAAPAGSLSNSSIEIDSAAIGASWLGGNGFFGASLSSFASDYGVPSRENPPPIVRIDLDQARVDLKGGWFGLGGPIQAIDLRIGINDYRHTELEDGTPGTRFENEAHESRIELMHRPFGEWYGAFGLQFGERRFLAIGNEAFVPPVDTTSLGAFIIEQRDVGSWNLSVGARIEAQEQRPSNGLPRVDDDAASVSIAAVRSFRKEYALALNVAVADRLPASEELYADGPHLASGTIEIGNPALQAETSRHFDIGLRKTASDSTWSVTAFVTDYDDFIYLRDTGIQDPVEALPVFRFDQGDARLWGLEAEIFAPIANAGRGEIDFRLYGDSVRGELADSEKLPRMPPWRIGARLQYHDDRIVAGLEANRYAEQNRTASFESATAGYTMLNADLNWAFATGRGGELGAFLRIGNMLDEEARKHTSLVKDIAPLPGRNITFGIRARF